MKNIVIRGACEHNLKNISLKLPKNKLITITGVSGSGKSSLAFDTIYAEGQRRYVESLSSYARQFLEQLSKPHIEDIEGLSPAIAIEQRTAGGSPRSIVATQTEIYDYLRLLFARIGGVHCYRCGRPIVKVTSEQIINTVLKEYKNKRIYILAPVVRGKKGEYSHLFKNLSQEGFARVRVDGTVYDLTEDIVLNKYQLHNIEILIDRVAVNNRNKNRIVDSIELALNYGKGNVLIQDYDSKTEAVFNTNFSCPHCSIFLEELQPRMFSFNSPYGACPACNGLGTMIEFNPDLVVPEESRSLSEGAILPWRRGGRGYVLYYKRLIRELAYELDIDLDKPFKRLSKKIKKIILYGSDNVFVWGRPFRGVIPTLMRTFQETDKMATKERLTKFMSKLPCSVCGGRRLRPESLSVYIEKKSIYDVISLSIKQAFLFFDNLQLDQYQQKIASRILKEIKKRLKFCIDVGIEYLTLHRLSSTLSGGEAQRIRLATQVGSSLSGVLYVLDEPTIGLHPEDNQKLIKTLKSLRDLANTVLVVEHDQAVMENSDWIVDLGPGPGRYGGKVVYSGKFKDMLSHKSLTADYIRGVKKIPLPQQRRKINKNFCLKIKKASEHNLKNINVEIPLGNFVCVTGVSGSGKSTLVDDTLYRHAVNFLHRSFNDAGACKQIKGFEHISRVIIVDQSPIGRTPRSNPATYTGVFTYIRNLFSQLPLAKNRGYKPARFSFNVRGGRCQECQGQGTKQIEMHFLPDIYIPCRVCQGQRFNQQTLEVKFKGHSISDVLNMDVNQAYELFQRFPRIKNILQTLREVGLGYIKLGQSATTLSGGEAQRMKLASQLRKRSQGHILYILDEPTTGLHFDDVEKLLRSLHQLVDKNNTVLIIEHNLEVIKSADYIIDLGPGGGDQGGEIVAAGAPEQIIKSKQSLTAKHLKAKIR